jgi:hypothetical protein
MNWAISSADPADGVREVLAKNGGISGFSTEVMLMPSKDLAVGGVRQFAPERGGHRQPDGEAARVARNILRSLLYYLP